MSRTWYLIEPVCSSEPADEATIGEAWWQQPDMIVDYVRVQARPCTPGVWIFAWALFISQTIL
jgi:hypothetical protein